jgi:2-succinyl-5-enolpyruvyl-6-hydroxy-3-cyclohexene-1-carboxylate synthase
MTPANLLTEWARVLFESLADAGLREVVVSPGSRSTPFVHAALACARLRATSLIDERVAGFFALGQAKVTGEPVALLCTSGSAAANYFPAVVEAAMSRTPLIVVTADRPFELQDAGASQTLDQTKLYGDYVRRFADVGLPDESVTALMSLRRRAAQCWLDAVWPVPGPVHLNVRARKPLEPVAALDAASIELRARADGVLRRPVPAPRGPTPVASDDTIALMAQDAARAERGVIVCGPSPMSAAWGPSVARLAAATGFPVYAETTSQLRLDGSIELPPALAVDALDVLLRVPAFRESFRPEVVLQIGDPPTSGAWEKWVAARDPSVAYHVVAAHGWPDPSSSAKSVVLGDIDDVVRRLSQSGTQEPKSGEWARRLAAANAAAWTAVGRVLSAESELSEGAAVRAIVSALPSGGLLAVGNSLPVRHVDAFCPAQPASRVRVWSQRGVSGIDGVVAGAAGAARAARTPTVLVVGDVSALHDAGGFAAAAAVDDIPLAVVVLDNDGGRIFEQLPIASAGVEEAGMRFWTTPHGSRFDGLAHLFGVDYTRAATLEALRAALAEALARPKCTLIHVPVPPHGARDQYARVTAELGALLAESDASRGGATVSS